LNLKEDKMSEYNKALALHLGGAGLCKLLFGQLKTSSSENIIPLAESGVGFNMTIDFLLRASGSGKPNILLEELICMAPSFHCYNSFLERLPSFQVTEVEAEYLTKLGHII
jgi:hypothetical protein